MQKLQPTQFVFESKVCQCFCSNIFLTKYKFKLFQREINIVHFNPHQIKQNIYLNVTS